MTKSVDLVQIKSKILERLRPSGWGVILETFIMGEEMDKILIQLIEDNKNAGMNPQLKHAFRAFELCKWTELRVVILGQDPFTHQGTADGLAFSGSLRDEDGRIQKQTYRILEEVRHMMYPHLNDFEYVADPDLTRWANQGVLLLNSALTTRVGTRGSHIHIWDPFIRFVLSKIEEWHFGIVFGFFGKRAKQLSELISDLNNKLFCEHPNQPELEGRANWKSDNFFNKTNQILFDQNGTEIHW